MAQLSAVLNLVGAVLIFYSFQAASTKLLLVTAADKSGASFCIGDVAVFSVRNHNVTMGTTCPPNTGKKPTAIVNTDAPWASFTGWIVLGLGFLLQLFSIEPSGLTNEDMRMLRKARKILGEKNPWAD